MKHFLTVLALALTLQGVVFAGPEWSHLVWPESPGPRDGHGMVALQDGRVVLFGGYGPSGFLGDLWVLSSGWTRLPFEDGPAPRYAHAMAALGNEAWVFGGYTWPYYKPSDDLWVLDGNMVWRRVYTPGPSARVGAAMASLGGRLYLYGGIGAQGILGDFWEFDPSSQSWKQLSASPGRRAFAGLVAGRDGSLWLYGGLRPPYRLGDTWAYEPDSGLWEYAGQGPEGRFWHAMAAGPDGGIYVFGGSKANWGLWFDDTWRLDPGNGVWERVYASGPSARAGAGLAAFGDGIILFGGVGAQGITGGGWFLRLDFIRKVGIDVKPGSQDNPLNPRSEGLVPVAILSEPGFYAPALVDRESLTFGRTGDEASLERCSPDSEDVNSDGLGDVVCHFKTPDMGLGDGDSEVVLRGRTADGRRIEGRDRVRIIGVPSLKVRSWRQ